MLTIVKVGDKLECINVAPMKGNDKAPDLDMDKEYEAKELYQCKCGELHINVGLPLELNYVECYKCRETLPNTNHWCHYSRFNSKK